MVNVIGLGYIGLPTALMLAANGIEVCGTDYKDEVVEELNHSKVTFKEEGLKELYEEAVRKKIRFSTRYQTADTYIVSVPTPYDALSKKVDSSFVENAVNNILDICPQEAIIVIESTVSPGTIDRKIRPIIQKQKKKVHLVHAPERIIPGNMIYELKHNSRTIGCDDVEVGNKIKTMYESFCHSEIVVTDIRTAEMTKVVENTYRDINIAFANELAKICRVDNMDVYEIIRIANKHPRVNILSPGPGVGGHCISVDPWFLVGDYPGLANIILAARKINDSMPEFVLERTWEICKEHKIDPARVGFYGLTYKEDVDDIRESPTIQMIHSMEKHLCDTTVKFYDPFVETDIVSNQYHKLDDFLEQVDIVVIMVGHSEIKKNIKKLNGKIVFDTRNIAECPEWYRL
ncbi:MAG: nucleotide sugar dehydrogenase [Eisenbergiella sp.]|nr:nucleotide sugar dehydrogenase [Bacillota bacterium]